MLLKSDGTAAAFGDNQFGQCNISELPEGISYTRSGDQRQRTLLHIEFGSECAAFYMLSGEEVLRVKVNATDNLNDLRLSYVNGIAGTSCRLWGVWPTGAMVEQRYSRTPAASLEP